MNDLADSTGNEIDAGDRLMEWNVSPIGCTWPFLVKHAGEAWKKTRFAPVLVDVVAPVVDPVPKTMFLG